MDRQNRGGSKPGAGGLLSGQQDALGRRERLRKLAMETIDLNKDPYFMRNHLGTYECKLCVTHHSTEGNYLAHTQGRRHQTNLARRAARDARDTGSSEASQLRQKVTIKKTIKIGRPGYKVLKTEDEETGQRGLVFELVFPDIERDVQPRFRIMSAFEQRVGPRDPKYQYILFAGEPYETVGFRIPNRPLDKPLLSSGWDAVSKTFKLEIYFAAAVQGTGPAAAQEQSGSGSPGDARKRTLHRPQIPFRAY